MLAVGLVALQLAQMTTCMTGVAGMTTCNSVPDYGATPPAVINDAPLRRRVPSSLAECAIGGLKAYLDGCSAAQVAEAKTEAANRSTVGGLIADGKCDDARRYALRSGDLDLAEHVARLCPAGQ